MSDEKNEYFCAPRAQLLACVAFTVLINVLLYLMIDGLFAIDLGVSGGGVLS